jgi:hypothetical protein
MLGDPHKGGCQPLVGDGRSRLDQRSATASRPDPTTVVEQRSSASRGSWHVCQVVANFYFLFFIAFGDIFFYSFFRPLHVARAWASWGGGGLGVQHPIF